MKTISGKLILEKEEVIKLLKGEVIVWNAFVGVNKIQIDPHLIKILKKADSKKYHTTN